MRSYVSVAVILGVTVVSAAPAVPAPNDPTNFATGKIQTNGSFLFPLSDGFPNPSDAQLADIAFRAGGSLPNGPAPPNLGTDAINDLRLIALNEIFEVAFFSNVLQQMSTGAAAWMPIDNGVTRDYLRRTLTAVQAQEEQHALQANKALTKIANVAAIPACQFKFPGVTDLTSAITLAETFTNFVLGVLQDVQANLVTGSAPLVPQIGAVIGQEGEQEGFYRYFINRRASESPFLTRGDRSFALSAIKQLFVVPGTCDLSSIGFRTIPGVLTLETKPTDIPIGQDSTVEFSITEADWDAYAGNNQKLSLVLVSQQNNPLVEQITSITHADGKVTFTASFPQKSQLLYGLTIAAVTTSAGPFTNVADVSATSQFGPALIEVN